MNQSSHQLSQEIAVLSDLFSDLGERLLEAARQLRTPGAPPPDHLLEELSSCRQDLAGLRARALELASSLGVPCPPPESLDNLQSIASLLDGVAEAEILQARREDVRRHAAEVLERVGQLSHAGGAGFAPLEDCKALARSLGNRLAGSDWADLAAEFEQIAEGGHGFSALLSLVGDHDDLSDDHWADLHELVASAFGKSLAAAAARGKIVLPADEPVAAHASA